MDARRMVTGVLVMILVLVGLSIAVPQISLADLKVGEQKPEGLASGKTMWCNLPNDKFFALCHDKQFMQGLTPAQKKAIDKEWQRRIPNMTPAERQKYYPAGTRYSTAGGEGG